MDDEVNDVIPKNIKPINVIIQGKTKIGKRPVDFIAFYA